MAAEFDTDQLKRGFRLDGWLVEPMRNRISREGEAHQVEPRVLDVLLLLARRPERTVTRQQFFEEVWAGMVVTDDVLARSISELRKVLGDDARSPRFVETIRKTGYRLIASVELVGDEHDQPGTAAGKPSRTLGGRVRPPIPLSRIPEVVLRSARAWFAEQLWPRSLGVSAVAVFVLVLGAFLWSRADAPDPDAAAYFPSPLTSYAGLETDPSMAPDGRHVVFAWDELGTGDYDLFIKQLDADTPLRLTDRPESERQPVWSPDKLHIAFVRSFRDGDALLTTPAIGGSEHVLLPADRRRIYGVAWSPAGDSLALAVDLAPGAASGLHMVGRDGTGLRPLTRPRATILGDRLPAFSPDGRHLAFVRKHNAVAHEIFVLALTDGSIDPVTFVAGSVDGLVWAPDGEHLIYASSTIEGSGLFRVHRSGSDPDMVLAAAAGSRLARPSIAGEIGRLVFAEQTETANIWRVTPRNAGEGVSSRLLIGSTRMDAAPAVSADGRRIAFVSDRSGSPQIWIAAADGSGASRLTDLGLPLVDSPSWSPDGRFIAFAANEATNADIYVLEVEGGVAKRLTTSPANDVSPAWSRDSVSVYFASDRGGSWDIWKQDVRGGRATRVTRRGGRVAREAPDGRSLLVVRSDTSGIWRVPLDDSLSTARWQVRLVDTLGVDDRHNWQVADGGIYYIHRGSRAPVLVRYDFESRLLSLQARLPDVSPGSSLAASPDGVWFLTVRLEDRKSDLMQIDDVR